MTRTLSQHAWINYNNLGKIDEHVNNLPGTFYSKSRTRLSHARVLHNCKQRHGWIEHNNISKTSLLNMLKIGMDHSVATRIHGIKILSGKKTQKISKSLKSATLRELLCMLVLVTTKITKIHGIHPCKDGMTYFKIHVGLKFIGGTH